MESVRTASRAYSAHALAVIERGWIMTLRLPGLYLFEIYWRSHLLEDETIALWTKELMSDERVLNALQMVDVLQFVRTRNIDHTAAVVLKYSVLFLVSLFLLLPKDRLVSIYQHVASLLLLATGHYMSIRYVQLEQTSGGGEVELDDFVKLERHGFHFLAQVMIALCVSCLLGVQYELGRVSLAIYAAPIVARMCGYPEDSANAASIAVERLHIVHNVSVCFVMLLICFYALSLAPAAARWLKHSRLQLKALIVVRGVMSGVYVLWQRLYLPALLCTFWLVLFASQLYAKANLMLDNDKRLDLPLLLLSAMAESTGSPLSVIALASTVSYGSFYILAAARSALLAEEGARLRADDPQSRMLHSGYAEGVTMLLLAAQTGLISLSLAQRTILLGLVMFIVLSALAQSLFDLLEPHLLVLGASVQASRGQHVRALCLALLLLVGPSLMVYGILRLLPFDIWLLIIMSNCLLTTLQTLSALILYCLFWLDAHARGEPIERLDDLIYYCRSAVRLFEFVLALAVIAYGSYQSLFGHWSLVSAVVLAVHSYFNVWRRLQSGWADFQQRRRAVHNLRLLAEASAQQLSEHHDVCAMCLAVGAMSMSSARLTPCGHLFHAVCLRKWLFVQLACPICHATIQLEPTSRPASARDEEGYSSDEDQQPVNRSAAPAASHPANSSESSDPPDDAADYFVDSDQFLLDEIDQIY